MKLTLEEDTFKSRETEKKNLVQQGRIQTFPMGRVLAGVSVLWVAFITYFNNAAVFFVQIFVL